jgi:hypothetical protein
MFALVVCQRMPPCMKRIQPASNVPLADFNVYQRMSDIFHTQLICFFHTQQCDRAFKYQFNFKRFYILVLKC